MGEVITARPGAFGRDRPRAGVAGPVDERTRIREIDVIRGAALFGVVLMNLDAGTAWFVPATVLHGLGTARVDGVVQLLMDWLVSDKAQCLFGMLFGFGFAIFTDRVAARGQDAAVVYARRLGALLVFGAVHFVFLWWGDILHDYALVGFVLLLTKRLPDRALLVAGVGLVVLSDPLGNWVMSAVTHVDGRAARAAVRAAFHRTMWHALSTGDYRAYLTQGVPERVRALYANGGAPRLWGTLTGQFLLGAWIFRKRWLAETAAHARLFTRVALVAMPVGLVLAGWMPVRGLILGAHAGHGGLLLGLVDSISRPVLAVGYAATLVVVAEHGAGRRVFAGLAAFGRMALTNYVSQSLVYLFVCYGFGLDLFTRIGAAGDLAIAAAVTAGQVAASVWWLGRFRFGPLEWLWRSVTYGRWQALSRGSGQGLMTVP